MAENLYNGARVPTPGDKYALTDDMKKMCLSLNIPIPVLTQAARDALAALAPDGVLPIGAMVIRRDQSMLMELWDGTKWATGAPHTEWTRLAQAVPSGTAWGVGALTQDATKTTDAAFVTHPAGDVLRFRDAGVYAISFSAKSNVEVTGRSFVEFQTGGSAIIRTVMTGEDRASAVIPNYRAAAGEDLLFDVFHTSGAIRNYDFRIRVTRAA